MHIQDLHFLYSNFFIQWVPLPIFKFVMIFFFILSLWFFYYRSQNQLVILQWTPTGNLNCNLLRCIGRPLIVFFFFLLFYVFLSYCYILLSIIIFIMYGALYLRHSLKSALKVLSSSEDLCLLLTGFWDTSQ